MSRLPLTVIGGYLGAGKTTLINRLLAEPHGLRLMVLVNDFGAINIDATLLDSATEDTLTLSNGCVCCTMGADLVMALGDALDRTPRPDHLIVEASGIGDPGRIAQTALAEPELSYSGVVTVVDGLTWTDLSQDAMIGSQLLDQVDRADVILVSKLDGAAPPRFANPCPALDLASVTEVSPLILAGDTVAAVASAAVSPHPDYQRCAVTDAPVLSRAQVVSWLQNRPKGVFRVKGTLPSTTGHFVLQVVGQQIDIRARESAAPPALVAIGPASLLSKDDMTAWTTQLREADGVPQTA